MPFLHDCQPPSEPPKKGIYRRLRRINFNISDEPVRGVCHQLTAL